jgi:GNAT superfamily N-acetyltransferase
MRIATLADTPEIVRVTNLAYLVEAFCIRGERLDPEGVRLLMAIGVFLVAPEGDGRLAGAVFLRPEGKDRFYLGPLSVDPACQGRGLGRALMAAAEAHCLEAGARFVDLTVVSARKELFAFYGNLGYHANEVLPFRAPEKLLVPCHLVRFTKCLIPPGEL